MELIKAEPSKNCKRIKANYNSEKDWRKDPVGYFLIRINDETKNLEIALCKETNVIDLIISGKTAVEVYNTFMNQGITLRQSHAAYLGKELGKAEIARDLGVKYIQDSPLNIKRA